jgi:superfamily II DNA or RNA helicase
MNRFSSRRQRLDQSFLDERLKGALAYDRIAGYFSSSILEVAGEMLESVQGKIRVICNSELEVRDVETAKAAQVAMRREWCDSEPELYDFKAKDRFSRLHQFLRSGKLLVRVMPKEKFGLIHGKAGVITMANGSKTSFIGSSNETYRAWRVNYELVWEDLSPESVHWVQEEFDALWSHPLAVNLADFVIEDLERLSRRTVVGSVDDWRSKPEEASPIIESPIYRKEAGLWEHQKFFVNLAFDAHRGPHGARFLLADQVGLGKTLQLAIAAELMALYGNRPVLVLAPKTLLFQWQDELRNLLDMPSAVWNGRQWVDENGIEYPVNGAQGIKRCPRRVGIVSQGLVVRQSEAAEYLKQMRVECVIVDEAHRARRKNLGPDRDGEQPEPNNLMSFLLEIAQQTKSLLLATATPVQIYPIEAWDLLNILSQGTDHVLGSQFSEWRQARDALALLMGRQTLTGKDVTETETVSWRWVRNPLPPAKEHRDFELLRRSLKFSDEVAVASPEDWDKLSAPDHRRVRELARRLGQSHNPFIRHIVRRTREFLENTIDPETNEPYLKPVRVELFGEGDDDAVRLPPYLRDAYGYAEEFCHLLGARVKGSGFLKTLLLRRVGSSIAAGRSTVEKMLSSWQDIPEIDQEEDEAEEEAGATNQMRSLTPAEREKLQAFLDSLNANQQADPKYAVVTKYLIKDGWLEKGCIIFSQYFDSVWWLANQLSSELKSERIGIYAGGQKSGVMQGGAFNSLDREEIKKMVRKAEIRLILGTDAASEGLNLQRLGTLINLDLPWNPTRLEQRKGRIQRIGQVRDTVLVFNMRYKDSVEDRVHDLLSDRLENIYHLFGQIPDVLEDVWVEVALGQIENAKKTIAELPKQHPFEIKYNKITKVPWETCAQVLASSERRRCLCTGWA